MTIKGCHRIAVAVCAAEIVLSAGSAWAQQKDEQLWLQVNTNVPVAPRVRATLEQIARFGDRPGGLYQTEFGVLLSYQAVDGVELGFGYRKVGTHNGNAAADEDRLRQQLVATHGPIFVRFRVDERFNPRGDEIGFRVRPLLRYNHRLSSRGLALFISHESFFLPNSTRWGQRRGYERMRNIVGFVVPLGRGVSIDAGYLNQYRLARAGARAQMDHALNLQLTINLRSITPPLTND